MDTKDKLVTLEDLKVVHDGVEALETRMTSAEADISDTVKKSTGGTFKGTVRVNREDGTPSTTGTSSFWVGNSTPTGTAGNSKGQVVIYGNGANYVNIQASNATGNRTVELPDANGTVALVKTATRIENPWESLDTSKCTIHDSDNFLYVNSDAKLVYFSCRFVMKVNTTGNLSIFKLKSAYNAYKPIMYSLNNGGVYFAHRTWSPDGGIQVFFGTNVGNVGIGTGAIANQGYIVQGMYFIA